MKKKTDGNDKILFSNLLVDLSGCVSKDIPGTTSHKGKSRPPPLQQSLFGTTRFLHFIYIVSERVFVKVRESVREIERGRKREGERERENREGERGKRMGEG